MTDKKCVSATPADTDENILLSSIITGGNECYNEIIDILNEKNRTLILGEYEDEVVRQAFKVDINDRIADLGSRISRKKQIIPTLEEYYNLKF